MIRRFRAAAVHAAAVALFCLGGLALEPGPAAAADIHAPVRALKADLGPPPHMVRRLFLPAWCFRPAVGRCPVLPFCAGGCVDA